MTNAMRAALIRMRDEGHKIKREKGREHLWRLGRSRLSTWTILDLIDHQYIAFDDVHSLSITDVGIRGLR
jgi:hypothetical protein